MAGAKSSLAPALGLLLLRLGAGGLLLYGHGWAKLMHYSERAAHFPDPLGIGSRHDQAELLAATNRILADLQRDGSYARLAQKWGVP